MEAEAGSSPNVMFTVTSCPPLPENCIHTLRKSDGNEATKRFKVESNCITFRKVRVEDSGRYTISCCNEEGEEGHTTLELDVVAASVTQTQDQVRHHHTESKFFSFCKHQEIDDSKLIFYFLHPCPFVSADVFPENKYLHSLCWLDLGALIHTQRC